MSSTTRINVGKFGIDSVGSDKALLTSRPDVRVLELSLLSPGVVLTAGIIAYLLPLAIDRDFQLADSVFIIGIGLVGIICSLALCQGCSKACTG